MYNVRILEAVFADTAKEAVEKIIRRIKEGRLCFRVAKLGSCAEEDEAEVTVWAHEVDH